MGPIKDFIVGLVKQEGSAPTAKAKFTAAQMPSLADIKKNLPSMKDVGLMVGGTAAAAVGVLALPLSLPLGALGGVIGAVFGVSTERRETEVQMSFVKELAESSGRGAIVGAAAGGIASLAPLYLAYSAFSQVGTK